MFEIGWSELVVVAVVAILVVGPKELPGMLRTVGKTIGNLRRMAGDFQRQFDQALKEAELDQVRKEVKAPFQPLEDARRSAEAFQKQVSDSVRELEVDPADAETPALPAATTPSPGQPSASTPPASPSPPAPALPVPAKEASATGTGSTQVGQKEEAGATGTGTRA